MPTARSCPAGSDRLRENIAAADLDLPADAVAELAAVGARGCPGRPLTARGGKG